MWTQVNKLLGANKDVGKRGPAVVPLRHHRFSLSELAVGKTVRFAKSCPLKPLSSAMAKIIAARLYRFGDDSFTSYQLQIGKATHFYFTVAEDDQGHYLSISRALNAMEQDIWFGRDALSFFTEASSAKSIRCKADLMAEGDWAAARYSKTVDWVEGTVAPIDSIRLARTLHYNLLVNEPGDKALEVEHDDANGDNRVFVTVYRPIEDIAALEDVIDLEESEAEKDASATLAAIAETINDINRPVREEPPLFREPMLSSEMPRARMDFRRKEEVIEGPIHIERTEVTLTKEETSIELPSFLIAQENRLELDEVIPPEAERVRVSIAAANTLIQHAMSKQVRVRDVLRDLLGLQSALSEEVIFELPLSDEDYRTLAMRYKLRPDHRVEIRSRLEEELRSKLLKGQF